MANAAAENALGTIGTVLWCIQIIPQIVQNYRRKNTMGLSTFLMFTWSASSIFLGIYCVVQNINIPIIIQPQLFGFLSAICWIQCLYYGPTALSLRKSLGLLTVYLLIFGGLETSMVFATKAGIKNGTSAPLTLFGVISVIGLLGALVPQYYEIHKYKEVIGLSLTFISIDMAGGVFCTLSLVFKEKFDVLASINYIGVVVLDLVILLLAAVLNPRAKRRRAREQAASDPCVIVERAESTKESAPERDIVPRDGADVEKASPGT